MKNNLFSGQWEGKDCHLYIFIQGKKRFIQVFSEFIGESRVQQGLIRCHRKRGVFESSCSS